MPALDSQRVDPAGKPAGQRRVRTVLLGTALAAAMALLPLHPGGAAASIGLCRTDPQILLTDGTKITVLVQVGADASRVAGVQYLVHVPAGAQVAQVVMDSALPGKETVQVAADNPTAEYDVTTTVTSTQGKASVATETMVAGTGYGWAFGHTGQDLTVHIGS